MANKFLREVYSGDISQKRTIVMLSKQSATNGWRVAPKEFFTKNASHIAGNDTFHALQVFILFLKLF